MAKVANSGRGANFPGKFKELGIVKTVHSSGIVETNKGVKSMIKANVGDRLVRDLTTNKISVAPKITELTISVDDYCDLGVDGLKEKYNLKELKIIAKQEGRTRYSKLNEEELANLIVFNNIDGEVADASVTNGENVEVETDEEDTTGTDDVSGDE